MFNHMLPSACRNVENTGITVGTAFGSTWLKSSVLKYGFNDWRLSLVFAIYSVTMNPVATVPGPDSYAGLLAFNPIASSFDTTFTARGIYSVLRRFEKKIPALQFQREAVSLKFSSIDSRHGHYADAG